jgi:3-oxoacyl-[acyl-carrier-protein] synthase II
MIAVTGIGVISPLGIGKQATLDSLRAGRSGICAPGESQFGPMRLGEAMRFRAKDFILAMKVRRLSRFTQLAVCSAVEAVADAGLDIASMDPFRTAVICSTALASTGSTDAFYEGLLANGPDETNPMIFPETVPNAAASQIAIHFGVKGPNTTFSQNETSPELALDYAMGLLNGGRVDAALVGGAEELNDIVIRALSALRIVSVNGAAPFDRQRSGVIPAEGGAVMVLERYEDAVKRGADIYAVLNRPVALVSSPVEGLHFDGTGESMARAMRLALGEAKPDQVGFISAAANGTGQLDGAEAGAIGEVFGLSVPVTALRASLGYALSDGIGRAACSLLGLKEGFIPATPGLASPVPGINLSDRVIESSGIRSVLLNSFAVGGGAASVLFELP